MSCTFIERGEHQVFAYLCEGASQFDKRHCGEFALLAHGQRAGVKAVQIGHHKQEIRGGLHRQETTTRDVYPQRVLKTLDSSTNCSLQLDNVQASIQSLEEKNSGEHMEQVLALRTGAQGQPELQSPPKLLVCLGWCPLNPCQLIDYLWVNNDLHVNGVFLLQPFNRRQGNPQIVGVEYFEFGHRLEFIHVCFRDLSYLHQPQLVLILCQCATLQGANERI